MNIESSQVTIARKQLEALRQEHKDLKKIRTIQLGHVKPGENPALIARAIRDFIPLPLKYTQSFQSLESLYKYSLETKDTKLFQWTCQQISNVFSKALLMSIKQSTKLPEPTPLDNSLKRFRKTHGKMNFSHYMYYLQTEKNSIPPFFAKQMDRIARLNAERSKISKEDLGSSEVKSCADTLSVAFLNQDMVKRSSAQYAPTICKNYNINPIVSVSVLIDTHGPRVGFHEIVHNEVLRKKKLFKETLSVPKDIILAKLSKYNTPPYYLEEIEKLSK